jgi:hypothetical protein
MGPRASGGRTFTLGSLVGAVLVTAGFIQTSRPIYDNSFLTHLATGRLILDSGSVPRTDPYTFTAAGEPWVVQSWLVSVLYAAAEEIAGPSGIRFLLGLVGATLVAVVWMLTRRCESIFARVIVVGLVLGVGAQTWFERPLMVGLLFLVTSMLVVERGWSALYLVPVGWVWANSHGSFPLGIVLLVLVALGARLDRGSWGTEPRHAGALVLGVMLGVIGPLGPALLAFPFRLLAGSEVLDVVIEWRAPAFDSLSQRLFLVQLAAAVVLLVRRPSWRAGLPMLVFSVAALTSLRNVAVASLVLVPPMASSMPSIGQLRSSTVPRSARPVAATVAVLALLVATARLSEPDYRLAGRYPVVAIDWAVGAGVGPEDVRMAGPEPLGNLLDLLYGPAGVTFYDDRFDMFPKNVSTVFLDLRGARPGWWAGLEDLAIDVVVWRRPEAPPALLAADVSWSPLFIDDQWAIFGRR